MLAEANQAIERSLREDIIPGSDSQPTTEDWYCGRGGGSGTEEDYYWRRPSDNWYQKDVVPSTYVAIHNEVFEVWNANPIVEMGGQLRAGRRRSGPRPQQKGDRRWSTPSGTIPTTTWTCASTTSARS
jgi:hypothetical protein